MSEPILVAQELEREYRMGPEPVRVLRGVSLAVNAGESIAIIGASGVGKSTLLHLLGTLDRPSAGHVLWDGADVSGWSDAALARLRRTHVSFIFQFYNLLGEMTALENAMLPALIQRAGGTTLHIVPSMLRLFLDHAAAGRCTSIARVICRGVAMPAGLAVGSHERLPRATLQNLD
jgi:lipoprotein-releasing system ATP-binding protein